MKFIERIRISSEHNIILQHKESDLKKRFAEVVEERNKLLRFAIKDVNWFMKYGNFCTNCDSSRICCEQSEILLLVEQITGKSWDEIKEIRA